MSHFNSTVQPRSTKIATGEGNPKDIVPGQTLAAQLSVSDGNDATASLIVKLQDSLDNGITWNDLITFDTVTDATAATRTAPIKDIDTFSSRPFGRKLRAIWTITGDEAAVAATLSTNLTGANNDLTFTADTAGAAGNDITITYVDPEAADEELAVDVTGTDIVVTLATDESEVITSTAALIDAAIEAVPAAAALVNVANKAANDGSGVVTALTETNLSGGSNTVDTSYEFKVDVTTR